MYENNGGMPGTRLFISTRNQATNLTSTSLIEMFTVTVRDSVTVIPRIVISSPLPSKREERDGAPEPQTQKKQPASVRLVLPPILHQSVTPGRIRKEDVARIRATQHTRA